MQGIRLGPEGAGPPGRAARAGVAGVALGEGRRPAVAGRTRCVCPGQGPRRPAGRRRSNPHGVRPRRMDESTNPESTVPEPVAEGDPGLTVPLNGDDPAPVVAGRPARRSPTSGSPPPCRRSRTRPRT